MNDKRKYVILVGDGMSDWPGDFPGAGTPLSTARTPFMDRMASRGVSGLARTIPEGMEPGSDVANMSLLGADPRKHYSGRAPLEAASMGVELAQGQVAYRCNLVHIEPAGGGVPGPGSRMVSHSAGHIGTDEAREIIEDLSREIARPGLGLYPGVSYRHLMVLDGAPLSTDLTPPHDITGKEIAGHLPKGEGAEILLEIMKKAAAVLADHPVNVRRAALGKLTANSVWLWGHGSAPYMPSLEEQYGVRGAVVSAVDLIKGLGKLLGMEVLDVPGATGYLDTDYEGKVRAALGALGRVDLVFVHVEAPDEAGHQGDLKAKIQAIEDFDRRVVGAVLDQIGKFAHWRVMAVTDHPTPLSIKTHADDPVPYAILGSEDPEESARAVLFNEVFLAESTIVDSGGELMKLFLGLPGHEQKD